MVLTSSLMLRMSACDLGVEEGAGDDFERERHHGGGDVEGLAGLPCGRGAAAAMATIWSP